jgi:sister chromatid cohesion protein DCC1
VLVLFFFNLSNQVLTTSPGNLRPISLTYLNQLLELVLNLLVSLSQPHTCASVEDISSALANGHEVPRVVSAQVMSWFGDIHQGKWKIDVDCVIREVGLGILRNHKVILPLHRIDEMVPSKYFE